MNYSDYRFTLDVQIHQAQVSVPVSLNDTARKLCIGFTDGRKPYVIEDGCIASFVARKPDGTKIHNYCVIERNTVIYEFTPQTTNVVGVVSCEIRLQKDGVLLVSPQFTIVVDKQVVSDDEIVFSADEHTSITKMLDAEAERAEAEKAREDAEDSRAEAEKAREDAEKAREDAEAKRVQAETNRQDAFKIPNILVGEGEYSIKQADTVVDGITNTAISDHSSALGRGTTAGCKGFKITAVDSVNKTYTLSSSPETYASGDVFSIKGFVTNLGGIYFYTNYGTIASVNGNVVTLNNYLDLTLSEEVGREAWFYVADKPHDGDNDIGVGALAEGKETKALGTASHAEGRSTQAIGFYSHAEGRGTIASFAAHAEGVRTKAMGESSHAEGLETLAAGIQSHAEGCWTEANGNASHAEGSSYSNTGSKLSKDAIANGYASHVEGGGSQTTAAAYYGHAEGHLTTSANIAAHAEGYSTNALGKYSHVEGYNTKTEAIAESSHAEGSSTTAKNSGCHAEGLSTTAEGVGAHSEGRYTLAKGDFSHAEGSSYLNNTLIRRATAQDYAAHVEGIGGVAGLAAHSEGYQTDATGNYSHSEGYMTKATATASHAAGVGTQATAEGQSVVGKYNVPVADALFIVGNGKSATTPSNALVVKEDGTIQGNFSVPVADKAYDADFAEIAEEIKITKITSENGGVYPLVIYQHTEDTTNFHPTSSAYALQYTPHTQTLHAPRFSGKFSGDVTGNVTGNATVSNQVSNSGYVEVSPNAFVKDTSDHDLGLKVNIDLDTNSTYIFEIGILRFTDSEYGTVDDWYTFIMSVPNALTDSSFSRSCYSNTSLVELFGETTTEGGYAHLQYTMIHSQNVLYICCPDLEVTDLLSFRYKKLIG